jgi:hypothetical protein
MGSQNLHVANTAGFFTEVLKGTQRRFDLQFEEREGALSKDANRLMRCGVCGRLEVRVA